MIRGEGSFFCKTFRVNTFAWKNWTYSYDKDIHRDYCFLREEDLNNGVLMKLLEG